MKRIILILITTIIGTLTSYACKCFNVTFTQEVFQSDQIFIGIVLKKMSARKVYYLFSISQMSKGEKSDTLTITTGFGGGDCGINFEIGKTYIVYSNNKATNRCRRNSLAANSSDLGKLKYLFQNSFTSDIGKTTDITMTGNEAEYFNSEFVSQLKDFDFHKKKVGFFLNGSLMDKQQYFKSWGGKDVVNDLIVLTPEEKQKVNDLDVIIVSWRKQGVRGSFRNRLIKKLM